MAKRLIQEYLPGTGPARNERVHKAGLELLDLEDKLKGLKKEHKIQHEKCLQIMRDEKLPRYVYKLRLVIKPGSDKVTCRLEKDKKPRVKKTKAKKAAA